MDIRISHYNHFAYFADGIMDTNDSKVDLVLRLLDKMACPMDYFGE